MSTPLRTLLVGHSELDAQILLRALRRDGFEVDFMRVETSATMRTALTTREWDLVLCDNTIPEFDALSALRLLRETDPELPFIIVSDPMGEERAVEAIKLGATDYLLTDRLSRLGTAVNQALEKSRHCRELSQTATELRASDARLRAFIENIPALIFVKDMAGRYLHVNPVFEKMFQLTPTEIIGKTDAEIFPAKQAATFLANDRQVLESGRPRQFEEQARYFDGLHTSVVSKFPLKGPDGRVIGIGGMATDITERKRSEEALRTAQETVQAILDSSPVAILGLDLEGRITKWNAGAAHMFGWSEAEVLGEVCPTVPPDGRKEFFEMVARVARQGPQTGMTYVRQKKSGEQMHASLSAAPLRNPAGTVVGVMVILEDITERVRAQAALQQSEREQRQLAQQLAQEKSRLIAAQALAKVGSWETDVATGKVSWSDETHRIFETDSRTFQPTHAAFIQLVHPDDRLMVDKAFADSLSTREPCAIEHRVRMQDGRIKIIEERWTVFFAEPGLPVRAVGTSQDITERKRAGAALRDSEERFRAVFEQAGICIALVGPADGRILRCNRALGEMLGYSVDELARMTVKDISAPDDYAEDHGQWEQLLAGEFQRFQMEKRFVHKDGQLVWGLLTATAVRDPAGRGLYIVGMVEDITARKSAEAQLHALVGRLNTVREDEAKRIARELHDDLGQRLTALNMELSSLEMNRPDAKPAHREQIARIQAAVDDAIQVVQKISSELRLGQLDVLGLTAAIEWHAKEFSRLSAIPCRTIRLDEVAGLTDAQCTNLFRIFQEALTNISRHAGASEVVIGLTATREHVLLIVRDNGRGITPLDMADRKAIGLLGMRERAQIVGGTFTISGAPGEGTVVRVSIPRGSPHAASP